MVTKAARAYYKAGKLIAQNPELITRQAYRIGEYRCAIGAALNSETLDALDKAGLTDGAFSEGYVKPRSKQGLKRMQEIQTAHDAWAVTGTNEARLHFLALLR